MFLLQAICQWNFSYIYLLKTPIQLLFSMLFAKQTPLFSSKGISFVICYQICWHRVAVVPLMSSLSTQCTGYSSHFWNPAGNCLNMVRCYLSQDAIVLSSSSLPIYYHQVNCYNLDLKSLKSLCEDLIASLFRDGGTFRRRGLVGGR
jgi:hypothetical protein